MDRWAGKVAIVTGASAGIGLAIVRSLVEHGLKVVGAARRLDKLQELGKKLANGKGKFYPVQCDVEKEEDILRMFEWTERELGGVDVLVNNAGVLINGPIIGSPTESFRKVLNVNVIAVAICTREAVRSMKKRGTPGHIININSVAGHFAESIRLPLGLYPASKYAVTAMTAGIRNDLVAEKLNIKITCISPGAVKTQMIAEAVMSDDVLKVLPMLEDKDISDAVIYALSSPPATLVNDVIITPHEGAFSNADSSIWTKA